MEERNLRKEKVGLVTSNKMDKSIAKEFLKDNCETTEEIGYLQKFTETELADRKSELAELDLQIAEIELEKAEANKAFKELLKPLNEMKADILHDLKEKAVYRKGTCFKFLDHSKQEVGYYDSEGNLVEQRMMRPEDSQMTVKYMEFITGTNN